MSDLSSHAAFAAAAHLPDSLPEVRLELRQGTGRPTSYQVSDLGFLIGTVPGCDLRLPGTGLPALLCLIARAPGETTFRKLAPTQTILLNGQSIPQAALKNGDRLTVGTLEILVHIQAVTPSAGRTSTNETDRHLEERKRALDERAARLEELQRELDDQAQTLQADRVLWYQRREEIQKELAEAKTGQPPPQAGLYLDLEERERALADRLAELERREKTLEERTAELDKQKEELIKVRQELAGIRRELYDRYQERRDRLAGLQEAVNRAARKVQEQKRQIDEESRTWASRRQEEAARQAELETRAAQLTDLVQKLEEERRHFQEDKAGLTQELDRRQADLENREQSLIDLRRQLDERQQQYQADLVRLDRLQATLEERDRQLQAKARDIEEQFERLRHDSGDLEEQVAQLDDWRSQLEEESGRLGKQKEEQDKAAAQLAQRAASLEGQQATLAALRTRLERMREEVRRDEQLLAEQRDHQESVEAELQQQLQETLCLRADLDAEQKFRDQERQQLAERGAVLEAAVNQLRQAQNDLAGKEEQMRQRALELDQKETGQAEQAASFQGRLAEIEEERKRLEEERQALRERTRTLAQAEQVREKLQEQLRRRAEELAARQGELDEKARLIEAQAVPLETHRVELENRQHQLEEQEAIQKQQNESLAAELEQRQAEVQRQEQKREEHFARLQEAGRNIINDRKALKQEQEQFQGQKQELAEAQARQRAELDALAREAGELLRQMPDLELRAGTALERLSGAREQLRDHLAEVHAYSRQCQEDLESLRAQVQAEAERVQQREQALRRAQDEHRLAVADFRQQLIDWQAQVAEKKRLLTQDETRLEHQQARVNEQAREIDATSQRLAHQAEHLQEQERLVAGQRQEMTRHLADMREWYRKKMRELAGTREKPAELKTTPETNQGPEPGDDPREEGIQPAAGRNILALTGPVDEADRRLGDLLGSLELVDADTLTALLVEARRQRRSLRQVLLAGGVVTLYQMALIEAGQLDALVLGPVRVVDRLRATPRETVYRVFDPRRGQEAVLRHLAEAEMQDPAHVKEFRQRFTRAQFTHPQLARTLEVLDIAGRPAVLQEWLNGLPCPEWPPLASVPGVCFRLLSQAALGLASAHEAGLVHGHLDQNKLFLTSDGTLKICGLGEPSWLTVPPYAEHAGIADDLAALGQIAAAWSTSGVRKGAKTKPLPPSFLAILNRLNGHEGTYDSAAHLLADLDRISPDVPANAEAWDRLLKFVQDHAGPESLLRKSA